VLKLVLLPGMDGTGGLFADFITALPADLQAEIIRYPTDHFLSYAELADLVRSRIASPGPFALVAESFSTPLAIRLAAENPTNLKGLVLCAGFARSPVRGLLRSVLWWLAPILFRFALPSFGVRLLLAGIDAPDSLVDNVRAAVSSVRPSVFAGRLRGLLDCDVQWELARIGVPILYLRAKQDRLVSARRLEDILRIRLETKVAVLDGPHLLLQRRPEVAAGLAREFVMKLSED